MRTSRPDPQPALERRAAEAQLGILIARLAPSLGQLIGTMRRRLRKQLPTAHELVYEYSRWLVISFSPSEHGYEGVLAIRADADRVKLYFNRGKVLPDPDKLLRGSAQVRWVGVEGASTLTRPAVARLIEEAIARNPVPFPRSGRGPVVIKSGGGKKGERRDPA
jgi:hypothetical protein